VSTVRDRLRVSLAGYDEHRERAAREGADPDADWWHAAWAEALVPVLREILAGMSEHAGPDGPRLTEWQLVRHDGTVLTSRAFPPGVMLSGGPEAMWAPEPFSGHAETGRCYGRWRETPAGPWTVIAAYPDGWPGVPLWDNSGEGAFLPFNPGKPAMPRGPEADTLSAP
jgi:hypothetical protein